jgi:hypothetical protein
MFKSVLALMGGAAILPFYAQAEPLTEVTNLSNYISAQSSCAVYLGHLYKDYEGAGFASEEEAKTAINEHGRLAIEAVEELISLFLTQDFEGEGMVQSMGDGICVNDLCLEKREYLAGMFFAGSRQIADDRVTRKSLSCPSGEWLPCTAAEPPDNWYFKAKDLYETANCLYLLP